MYQAHFATALLLKSLLGPSIPSWPIIFGSSLLDIVGGLDAALGLSTLTPNPHSGPYMYTDFHFIDWEHSLLMMLLYSVLFAWVGCHVYMGYDRNVSLIGAASSIVHWLMDVLVVAPTAFTLYPHGSWHFGLGMYERYPLGSWVAENVYTMLASYVAYRITLNRNTPKRGADISPALYVMAALCVLMSPWLSPLLVVARLYEAGWLQGKVLAAVQMGGFVTAYVVPAVVLVGIVDGAERDAKAGGSGKEL